MPHRPSHVTGVSCPGGRTASRTSALLLAGVLLCGTCGLARGEEPAWLPASIQTRDGSKFIGLLQCSHALVFRRERKVEETREFVSVPPLTLAEASGLESFDWRSVQSLTLTDRPAPEALTQAEQSVRELASEDYQTRERAIAKLRELGRSAAAALRKASTSSDAEVSTRAKELLAELGSSAAEAPADRVTLAGGGELRGQAAAETFLLQTRWGLLRMPSGSVESLVRMEHLPAELQLSPPPPDAQALEVRAAEEAAEVAKPGIPLAEELRSPDRPENAREDQWDGLHQAGFLMFPLPGLVLKQGVAVEDFHAGRGVLMRATDSRQTLVLGTPMAAAPRIGSVALTEPGDQGSIEVRFAIPGTFDPHTRSGQAAGVYQVTCLCNFGPFPRWPLPALEAYDRSGRCLVRVEATPHRLGIGIRSRVPMARLVVCRADGNAKGPVELIGVGFGRLVPLDHDPAKALLALRSGERLTGDLKSPDKADGVGFSLACLPPAAPALRLALSEVESFEPAVSEDAPRGGAPAGTPHAVLLQDGSAFRAGFVKLDAEQVTLELAQQARLTLPRALLRKVDLYPEAPAPNAPLVALTEGEKPGVQFRPKPGADPAKEPAKEPGKDPAKEPAKEQPRMDGAEILAADIKSGELSVDPKDGGGAWTIDLRTARFLVFPPRPAPPAGPPPEWVVVLAQGTRFAVNVRALTPEKLEVEFSGGKVTFPWAVVQTLQRAAK